MSRPRITFDTSALTDLAEGGPLSEPYIKALNCGFDVWLTAMSVDEIISTPDPATRDSLIACCQRVLVSGLCVWPPHIVVTLLASAHAQDPGRFDWRKVDIRAAAYERAVIDRDFSDELCARQLNEQILTESRFMNHWRNLRRELEPILEKDPEARPTSYRQAAKVAREGKPNLIWAIGQALYSHVTGTKLDDLQIKKFLDACPPVRAACYGFLGSWYDVSLARRVHKKLVGRNDHMMSVYLAYCDRFVTQDRRQALRLHDVAMEAQVRCEVSSYDTFCTGLGLVGGQ